MARLCLWLLWFVFIKVERLSGKRFLFTWVCYLPCQKVKFLDSQWQVEMGGWWLTFGTRSNEKLCDSCCCWGFTSCVWKRAATLQWGPDYNISFHHWITRKKWTQTKRRLCSWLVRININQWLKQAKYKPGHSTNTVLKSSWCFPSYSSLLVVNENNSKGTFMEPLSNQHWQWVNKTEVKERSFTWVLHSLW